MKKRYLLIGLLTSSFHLFGQNSNSPYSKKKLSHNEVQVILSYYNQNNDHSAVTGGEGTEDLQVYSTQFAVDNIVDSVRTIHYNYGFDIITSASTDNIDFIPSSASEDDFRIHASIGYSKPIQKKNLIWGFNTGFSMESDYTSLGQSFSISHVNENRTRELAGSLQMYFDDLRWGRFQGHGLRELVYPAELRGTEWFDVYRRNSYNLLLSWVQTINQKTSLGIFPGLTYQSGLLSTPFHRVFFTDNTRRVENLPMSRIKMPLGVQLNRFMGTRWILRAYYRFYWDDYGINAHTINLETPIKMSRIVTITPFIRLYTQSGSDFFQAYGLHDPSSEFYTSDYDLSEFDSQNFGMALRVAPFTGNGRATLKALEMRFSHYQRSDGLHANVVSMVINYDKMQKKKPD